MDQQESIQPLWPRKLIRAEVLREVMTPAVDKDGVITFAISGRSFICAGYKAKAIADDGTVYTVDTVEFYFEPRDVAAWLAHPYDLLVTGGLTPAQAETIVCFEQDGEHLELSPWISEWNIPQS